MMDKAVLVNFPIKLIEKVDEFVRAGLYPSRNEAIRDAVRTMVNSNSKIVEGMLASKSRGDSS